MISLSARRAANYHVAGVECSETGNEDGAIENYNKALALDPKRGDTLYNLGLIYKYRGDWAKSFEFNSKAREFQPDDEATLWNLGIAATALRDWATAREVWRSLKVITTDGEGPINEEMGRTPVRVNAEGLQDRAIEVVWSERICPVRSRIVNIPTGATGFRYGDVVLHDGAPVGYRLNSSGQERPVFNVLELFEPSRFSTYEAAIEVESAEALKELECACESAGIEIDDWTASLISLCKACSEGRPHEGHDQELKEPAPWRAERRVGFAATRLESLKSVLKEWAGKPERECRRDQVHTGSGGGMRAFSALGASIVLLFGLGGCSAEQREVSRQISPNQKLVAVLMESQLKDSAGSLREDIYLNDQGLPLNLDKPVFSGVGCDHLSYEWANDYTLQIHYETTCAISHFSNRWDRPSDVAAGRPNPIEIILIRG